jgi:hypothetical protein
LNQTLSLEIERGKFIICPQADAIQQKSEELLIMREKVTSLELSVQSGHDDKSQTEVFLDNTTRRIFTDGFKFVGKN